MTEGWKARYQISCTSTDGAVSGSKASTYTQACGIPFFPKSNSSNQNITVDYKSSFNQTILDNVLSTYWDGYTPSLQKACPHYIKRVTLSSALYQKEFKYKT